MLRSHTVGGLLWAVWAPRWVLIGAATQAALMPAVAATLSNIYGASVSSLPVFNVDLFLQALLLAVSGLLLAMVLPLVRSIGSSGWARLRVTKPFS